MGRSQTINCIGEGPEVDNQDGTFSRQVYYAMNRVEIAQEVRKAEKREEIIERWSAQTKTGEKSLGLKSWEFYVDTAEIPLPKLVKCPICQGQGTRKVADNFIVSCVICNHSGITKNNNWKHWQEWQLESIKANFS